MPKYAIIVEAYDDGTICSPIVFDLSEPYAMQRAENHFRQLIKENLNIKDTKLDKIIEEAKSRDYSWAGYDYKVQLFFV